MQFGRRMCRNVSIQEGEIPMDQEKIQKAVEAVDKAMSASWGLGYCPPDRRASFELSLSVLADGVNLAELYCIDAGLPYEHSIHDTFYLVRGTIWDRRNIYKSQVLLDAMKSLKTALVQL